MLKPLPIKHKIPKIPKKHIMPWYVRSFHHTIFVVGKDKHNKDEQDVVLHFGEKLSHRVVKLNTRGLPHKSRAGNRITWINNFGIVDRRGNYVDGVPYTLILPALPSEMVYVTYQKGEVRLLHLCAMAEPSRFVLAELAVGDPPVGARPREDTDPII
jgi:hypothetical protein